MFVSRAKSSTAASDHVVPLRHEPIASALLHHVFHRSLQPPYPEDARRALFGMGCFWGAERIFWRLGEQKIWISAVGYAGGATLNPNYEQVCSGLTGHAEVVAVIYRPERIAYKNLLEIFWENHDPTQGMRQGGDVGTQYRSAIYADCDEDLAQAESSRVLYAQELKQRGFGAVTTEIAKAETFFFAEAYHQQYLSKNPNGYCGLGGTGVSCPRP